MRVPRLVPIVLAAGLAGCLGGGHRATATFTGDAQNCPIARSYRPSLAPSRGVPGTQVLLTGVLPVRDEAGEISLSHQTRKLEAWWNLNPRAWETALTKNRGPDAARAGPVREVLSIAVPRPAPCRYTIPFTVPASEQGSYPVQLLYRGGGGAAGAQPVFFTVTS